MKESLHLQNSLYINLLTFYYNFQALVEDVLEESLREIKKESTSSQNHLNLMDSFEREYFKKATDEEKASNSGKENVFLFKIFFFL